MTTTPWAHLPNARYIDAVLADVKARPEAWGAVRDLNSPNLISWRVAFKIVQPALWEKVTNTIRGLAAPITLSLFVWDVTTDVLCALIAWDSSADLLDCTPDVLRTMIDLAEPPVCHQAALLLPYAIVRMTK